MAEAVDARVVAVNAGPPSLVTYTTGRAKILVGIGTEIASTLIDVDCALAKALSAARAGMTVRMTSNLSEWDEDNERSNGRRFVERMTES